jgi:uncharacterized protein (DUF1778 family)
LYGYLPYNAISFSFWDISMGTVHTHDKDTDAAARTARLEARITGDQKALFQRAAVLSGRSLTDIVVSSVQDAASRTIREHEVMTVTGRDRDQLVAALLDAPEPGQRLRKAADRYRDAVKSS